MTYTETLSLTEAETLLTQAFMATGVSGDAARSVARGLVAAEAEGQVGHGFSRLADYAAQAKSGKVNPKAHPIVTKTGETSLLIDAEFGFAFPALDRAIDEVVTAAKSFGTASAAITKSHHSGALSVHVDKIAREGLIALMVANTPPAMAPWGAKDALFGTNPIAFAAPRENAPPLVIDLSLSRVARGKVMHAKKTGGTIPEGWALDKSGKPTTDPEAALAGSMVPIGEAKGTALALMVEVLAATLSGANPSPSVSSFFIPEGPPPGSGQFLLAMRPGDPAGFGMRLEALLGMIADMEGARLPGQRRLAAMDIAREHGITVPSQYVAQARALAENSAEA